VSKAQLKFELFNKAPYFAASLQMNLFNSLSPLSFLPWAKTSCTSILTAL